MRCHKIPRAFLLVWGGISLAGPGVLAKAENHSSVPLGSSNDAQRCKASLQRFSIQLKQHGQPYCKDLYQKIESFLQIPDFPANPSQLDQCENFLNVIQSIGGHAGSEDLAPMPEYSGGQRGGLTKPTLKTGREKPLSIRYETHDFDFKKKEEGEGDEGGEDEFDEPVTPLSSSGMKKSHALAEEER